MKRFEHKEISKTSSTHMAYCKLSIEEINDQGKEGWGLVSGNIYESNLTKGFFIGTYIFKREITA